jgi:hypothetical protein
MILVLGIVKKIHKNDEIVERPDPKGLSTFSLCTEHLHRGFELMSSRSGVRRSN